MQWLEKIVDELIRRHPEGEIVVESGIAPSGSYHMGYLREIIMCDAIFSELKHRGRDARHIHFVDDFDPFRKVPANVPAKYSEHLGKPLCDIPAPDGSNRSYADYALQDFLDSVSALGINVEVVRSHQKYRSGYFSEAIEKALSNVETVRKIMESVSGRKLDPQWSPIQVIEDGYLKKRPFVGINLDEKTVTYLNLSQEEVTANYERGEVKLDWRLDWPARWWLVGVHVEPFGREHGTKGGSYDTGVELVRNIFGAEPPLPLQYEFINRAGDTKKMSASSGNGILMSEVVRVLPSEVIKFFILNTSPSRQIFFDPQGGVVRLIDEFSELVAKENKTDLEKRLVELCTQGIEQVTVSNVPFSHLVASYQAALKNEKVTMEIIERTEHAEIASSQKGIISSELQFIDKWLEHWAPDDVKFELADSVSADDFSEIEKKIMSGLADKISQAPSDADGEWFHKAVYEFKETLNIAPKDLFVTLYRALINKESGPRAGWFLSILPRDWLIKRLRLEE